MPGQQFRYQTPLFQDNRLMIRATTLSLTALAASFIGATLPAHAQVAPDAGRTLQELAPPLPVPKTSPGIDIQAPTTVPSVSGGASVRIQSVNFSGNTRFTSETLHTVMGNVAGQSFDLAGLRGLTDRITTYYHETGYPFARAFLPPQALADGALLIEIVEGRYGQVTAMGDKALAASAQGFLGVLKPGAVIESSALERATLILDDQPGIKAAPVIKPGQQPGTGDLDVRVTRAAPYSGNVGLDNYGNYYSGQIRAHADLNINSPFMLGDQISMRALYTQEKLWLGSLGYGAPLGASGLRGNLSYAQTSYTLGNGFEGNEGIARISSAGLTYPIVRSQASNLNLGAALQYKKLYNSFIFGSSTESYSSTTLPLSLSFDHRDSIAGGGITYGALSWTYGNLHKDDPVRDGGFNKLNLDLMRLQALPGNWTLFVRLNGQLADKNLDSSEAMFLGGPTGVRAYPTGEASGDEGWLAQIELRYRLGAFSPYVFYDHGRVKVNAKPHLVALASSDLTRAGAGVGLRFQSGPWSLDGTLAWRTKGGQPTSDTHADPKPRLWLAAGYRF